MINTIETYLDLITSAFRLKPKFTAMISADVSPSVQVQALLTSMIPLFDVDTAAGDQLDIIGEWVGVSRNVSIPAAGVYFSWDAAYTLGWDYGAWQANLGPSNITSLPDDAYRTLIKGKIAANKWDGTTSGAYAVFDEIFTGITILIEDHQNMSYSLGFVGGIIDSLTVALVTGGYLQLKPEAIRISSYFFSVDANPVFSWDVDQGLLAGWDEGSWVREA